MRGSLTISAIVHLVALGMCLVALAAQPVEAPATPAMTVNTISVKDFTELTKGVKDAPKLKVDDIKPVADKVDTPKPVDEVAPKPIDKKPEIKTDTSAKQQPKPDQKPDNKPDPKPADKPAKAKPPDYKPDKIADLLKKDAAKQPKPDDKASPDAPPRDSPKFNADQVAALLDKRDPQRQMAAAETLNSQPNLGESNGAAAQLSQSEIDALRARISNCWSPPPGVNASTKIYVVLRVLFKQDASMSREPVLVEGTASPLGPALAESAKRALLLCQPFTMLKPEHYDQWKDLELKFDPQELLGG
jgi:outer membrane biosynthesis protein TonB